MASTSGSNMQSLQNPIFIGKNYEYWFLTMKDLFKGQDLWEIVQNGYIEPVDQMTSNNLTHDEKDAFREKRKKDGKAMFYIHQAMHESLLPRIATTIIAMEEYDTLEIGYQGLNKVNPAKLQILRRDFESMSMKDIE